MSEFGNDGKPFNHGERVIVADLRSGMVRKGFVIADRPPLKLEVRYDTGESVYVGRSFVRRDDGR